MQPTFAEKLVLRICQTNVDAQKIDGSRLETYGMIIALVQVDDKDGKSHFFEKTLLLADISMDITFRIRFFMLNNVKVTFNN